MRERYTRPPLLGAEHSDRLAVWRFRVLLVLALLVLAAAVAYLIRATVTGAEPGNPGVGALSGITASAR